MPDWFTTRLKITGPDAELINFCNKHIGPFTYYGGSVETVFYFNTVMTPDAVAELECGAEVGVHLYVTDIYDGDRMMIMFDTPWLPPIHVLKKLEEMWPQLKFDLEGRGEEDAWCDLKYWPEYSHE